MQPRSWPEPDPQIARAIAAMYRGKREAPLPVRVRDELGELFADAEFAAAFGTEGKPGWSPGRLALITVLQRAEGLTDRQTAETVRADLSWKYALGLALDDPGFDASVLSEFRTRVVAHGLEERALDLLLAKLVDRGLVKAGGKQRTDSTHVISAVRDLNRLEVSPSSRRWSVAPRRGRAARLRAAAARLMRLAISGIHSGMWCMSCSRRADRKEAGRPVPRLTKASAPGASGVRQPIRTKPDIALYANVEVRQAGMHQRHGQPGGENWGPLPFDASAERLGRADVK
ncbi:transposase [Nonomuraea cypriaca]|uniref:transposase n=1 Tax=Nonomuraea cypriaca TaxID=1187855 RepID=UPI001F308E4D|nr:transposase [Nonomuraea cypriaca]